MENNSLREENASSGNGGADGQFVFDTSSGFSVEEQREILDRINSLNVEKGMVPQEGLLLNEAKKRGHLFPLLVNAAALLLLGAGLYFLWSFHSRDEQDIREGQAVIGLTERRLIQEIRLETSSQINEKEQQISEILSRLEAAGDEYRELQVSVENLSEEQKERAQYLLNLQEEYQGTLSTLQADRAKILEDSRQRETALRAQAEEKAGELSSQIEEGRASLGEAMEELARLSGEQERAASAEALLGGYYTILDGQINEGKNDEALQTLAAMKEFLDGPFFMTSRSQETRKQNQLAAVAALEKILAAAQGLPLPDESASAEAAAAAALEQTIQEHEKTIDDLRSQVSSQSDTISGNEISLTELRNTNEDQQRQLNERDAELQEARAVILNRDQMVDDLSTALADRGTQAAASQARVTELEAQNNELSQRNGELGQQIETIRQLLQNQ